MIRWISMCVVGLVLGTMGCAAPEEDAAVSVETDQQDPQGFEYGTKPDLVIDFLEGGGCNSTFIRFRIRNKGLATAGASSVRTEGDGSLQFHAVGTLQPGKVSADITRTYPRGSVVTITADANRAVAEMEEGNNTGVAGPCIL